MFKILFLLFIFIVVIPFLFSSFILGKIGNKIAGKKGKYIGYAIPTLLVIGVIIYNIAEYYYIKNQVKNLCEKEAGVFVYVTPEQWKEENKDSLVGLYKLDSKKDKDKIREIEKEYKIVIYDDVEYKVRNVYNKRIILYRSSKRLNYFVTKSTDLLFDMQTNKVLAKTIYINSGVNGFMSINRFADLKEWINTIPNCYDYVFEQYDIYENFFQPVIE